MTGYEWEGIGLKIGDEPDPNHTFKGIYDGNGHTISNLQFKYDDSGVDGTIYRYTTAV